jgi:hypothetical protein
VDAFFGQHRTAILETESSPALGTFADFLAQRPCREVGAGSALSALERVYIIEDRAAVADFVRQNRLGGLLLQARGPLYATFGEAAMKTLRLVRDDEGFTTLFCLVMVPGDMQKARRALRLFDQQWWLDRCEQAASKLNFDFELV